MMTTIQNVFNDRKQAISGSGQNEGVLFIDHLINSDEFYNNDDNLVNMLMVSFYPAVRVFSRKLGKLPLPEPIVCSF